MATLSIAFLFCVTLQAVSAGSLCTYYESFYPYSRQTNYCYWECCSYESDGCCDAPFYNGASFIAPVVIGSIVLVIIIIVVAIISLRRRRIRTTIQYGAPYAQPQIVTTTTAANTYGAYPNQAYPQPPPAYGAQPVRY